MPLRTVQLRDIYPTALADRPTPVRAPGRPSTHGRLVANLGCVGFVLAMVTAGTAIGLSIAGVRTGPAITVLWWTVATLWALVVLLLVGVVVRGRLRRLGGTSQRWAEFATERGLTMVTETGVGDVPGLSLLTEGRERTYGGLARGRARATEVLLGTSTWVTGSGRSTTRHRLAFAHVELPAEVGELFPSTTYLRFLRPVAMTRIQGWTGSELRLESTQLDRSSGITVEGAPVDDVRWRELFDPVLMDGLVNVHDVQWQQRGRHLVLGVDGLSGDLAPATDLDTLAHAASFVTERFLLAVRGDVGPGAPLPGPSA